MHLHAISPLESKLYLQTQFPRSITHTCSQAPTTKGTKALGSATTGSSEAIMLGGLAMKRLWQVINVRVYF
jgi:glutamate/tyrosine decarboxylase-like PLP-dependent enzyme